MFNIIPSKPKSIKLSDYFEIKKNSYEILKLTPTKSNRNIKTVYGTLTFPTDQHSHSTMYLLKQDIDF